MSPADVPGVQMGHLHIVMVADRSWQDSTATARTVVQWRS